MKNARFFEPERASDFDADNRANRPQKVINPLLTTSGVDYSQYHPNSSWAHFRKNWDLIDDEKDREAKFSEQDLKKEMETGVSATRQEVYRDFLTFFGDLEMTKFKTVGTNSLYSARIYCLCNDKRYVFVVVNNDPNPLGSTVYLSTLYWDSFQTRTLREDYPGQEQNYPAKSGYIMQSPIVKTKDLDGGRIQYTVRRAPLEVQMLSKPKTNHSYADVATLSIALQTFNTVVYFV